MAATDFRSYLYAAERALNSVLAGRRTPIIATLLALLLLCYSLAQWSWRLARPGRAAPETIAPAMPTNNTASLASLLAANLFGRTGDAAGATGRLPVTGLNLVLTGVMLHGGNGYALIRIEGGKETPVVLGQEIQPGARLQALFPNRAVIARGGMLESLPLKEMAAIPGGALTGAMRPAPDEIRGSGNQYSVNRESLMADMQRPELLNQALMTPNPGGGFLVRRIQPGSLYEKLGVRAGDVIRSVNGEAIDNMGEVTKMYQQLSGMQSGGRISIEVMRAGRAETLQYRLE